MNRTRAALLALFALVALLALGNGSDVDLTVVPAKTAPIELTTTARALNAPEAKLGVGVAP